VGILSMDLYYCNFVLVDHFVIFEHLVIKLFAPWMTTSNWEKLCEALNFLLLSVSSALFLVPNTRP